MTAKESKVRAGIDRIFAAGTVAEINNAIAPTYHWQEIAGKRLIINSVKAKASDHRSESYAVVSFETDNIESGIFLIGGRTAGYLLAIEEWKFPVSLILHRMTGRNGYEYPKVERV